MALDRIALILVVFFAVLYAAALFTGLLAASPYSWPLLPFVAVIAYLVYRVVRDRLNNAEDDYYEKNIKE